MTMSFKDVLAGISVVLALLGLVWQAAVQVEVNSAQTQRIDKLERTQDQDHDSITQMKAGIEELLRRTKEREES
jgi:HAMP domain-containing protein